jgi:hypothetical protein
VFDDDVVPRTPTTAQSYYHGGHLIDINPGSAKAYYFQTGLPGVYKPAPYFWYCKFFYIILSHLFPIIHLVLILLYLFLPFHCSLLCDIPVAINFSDHYFSNYCAYFEDDISNPSFWPTEFETV